MRRFASWCMVTLTLIPMGLRADYSDKDVGTGAAAFLKLPVTARATALGGAGGPIAEGGDSLYYNPAQIGAQKGLQAEITGAMEPVETQHTYAGVTWAFNPDLGAGLSLNYFDVGKIDQVDSIGQTI